MFVLFRNMVAVTRSRDRRKRLAVLRVKHAAARRRDTKRNLHVARTLRNLYRDQPPAGRSVMYRVNKEHAKHYKAKLARNQAGLNANVVGLAQEMLAARQRRARRRRRRL